MKVRIKIRVRLSDGTYPFLDPVLSANGKLKPFYAVVDGKPEHHPEGTYFLRYAKNGKRSWERVGNDAQLALTAKVKREKTEDAKAAGVDLVEDAPVNGKATPLIEAVDEYLAEVKAGKSPKTFLAYSLTLKLFTESIKKTSLEAIDRKEVLSFIAAMRANGNRSPHYREPCRVPQGILPSFRIEVPAAEDRQGSLHREGGLRVLNA